MKWGLWSVTAGSNSATPPDGWPEGQAPSTVNDCAREMMAQIRTGLNDIQFIDLGVTPTQTGNVTFTLAGNQMQWYGYGTRVKANVGGTNYYGSVISSTFTTNTGITLRFDVGNGPLTASLSAVSTGFPSPVNGSMFDTVYRDKEYLHNSQFDLWTRGNGPFSLSSGSIIYTADRWLMNMGVTSAGASIAVSRLERSASSSNVPTLAQCGVFVTSSLVISCNAAVTSLASADTVSLIQYVEGYDFRQLAQKPITVSFWVHTDTTGTYCMALLNAGGNRSCVLPFSVSAASTWEKKILTFPKSPLAGTWDYSTGIGLQVQLTLASGGNSIATAGAWTSMAAVASSGQNNFVGGANRSFRVACFHMEEGNQATPPRVLDRAVEQLQCGRFVQSIQGGGIVGIAASGTIARFTIPLIPQMRTAALSATFPALAQMGIVEFTANNLITASAVAIASLNTNKFNVVAVQQGAGNLTPGSGAFFNISAGFQIIVSNDL